MINYNHSKKVKPAIDINWFLPEGMIGLSDVLVKRYSIVVLNILFYFVIFLLETVVLAFGKAHLKL